MYGLRLPDPAGHDDPAGILARAQDKLMAVAKEEESARARLHSQPRARHIQPPALDDVVQQAPVVDADSIVVLAHETPCADRLPIIRIVHRHLHHLDDLHVVRDPDFAAGLDADGVAQIADILHADQVLAEEGVLQRRPLRHVGHHDIAADAFAVLDHPIPGDPGARLVRGAGHQVGVVVVQGLLK